MNRHDFLRGAAALVATTAAWPAFGAIPKKWDRKSGPPMTDEAAFIKWGVETRSENPKYLSMHWARYQAVLKNKDLKDERNQRAFLMTPRENFVLDRNLARAYDHAFLDIGYGVTISGPHIVAKMTSSIDVQEGDKVLEIGTGSGYQSAYLSYLTEKIWTIEIIKPVAERTRSTYDKLITDGYTEFKAIQTRNADGYYGWADAGPFDKIVVTCGIDHVPPPLLQQLKVGGVMVIPVGPPGAQRVLKVVKEKGPDGELKVTRSDIYGGRVVPFVPFTKLDNDEIKGTHNQ